METMVKQRRRRQTKIPERRLPILPKNCPLKPKLYVRLKNLNKETICTLNPEEVKYIEKVFNYKVIPILYKIPLTLDQRKDNQPSIIKELIEKKRTNKKKKRKNFSKKKNKKNLGKNNHSDNYLYCELKHSDMINLILSEIDFRPYKYIIKKA